MQRIFLLIAAFVVVFGCGSDTSPQEMAQEEIFRFHQHYNNGVFEEIYSESSIVFKNAADEAEFEGLLGELRQNVGNHLSSTVVSANTVFGCTGATVGLSLQSNFEHAVLFEDFIFKAEKGKYRLAGYHYRSWGNDSPLLQDVKT